MYRAAGLFPPPECPLDTERSPAAPTKVAMKTSAWKLLRVCLLLVVVGVVEGRVTATTSRGVQRDE